MDLQDLHNVNDLNTIADHTALRSICFQVAIAAVAVVVWVKRHS